MPSDPWIASILYIISGLLDAIDGHLARMLNQGKYFNVMNSIFMLILNVTLVAQ